MPKADENENALGSGWSITDLAFALRELHEEFPLRSGDAIIAAIQAVGKVLPSTNGRVRLIHLTRELIRAG